MAAIVADTHAAIWYLLGSQRLSSAAGAAFDEANASSERIYLPAISLVEVIYLVEKQRLPADVLDLLIHAIEKLETGLTLAPLDLDVVRALRRVPKDLVPDMPDRIIAATALQLGLPLVTRDAKITASDINTIW